MEYEILDALEDVRYEEKIDESGLKDLLKDTEKYSKLLEWICKEIQRISNLEESVTRVETNEDLKAFHMELSSLLRELGYPYALSGDVNERFSSTGSRMLILNFILGELQAARYQRLIKGVFHLTLIQAESETARLLRELMQAIGLPKPPANIPVGALLSKVNERLTEIQKKMSPRLKDKPIFVGQLSEKQWTQLEQLDKQFQEEYHMRREMLLKRLDVTIQSFHWSDRLRNKKDELNKIFREKRDAMVANPKVAVSDILAARTDLAIMEKTSCASVRKNTKSAVNKVVIGRVPDRGGRPNEVQPPAPEMPPWQQRQGGQQGGWSAGPQTGQTNYGPGRGAQQNQQGQNWNQGQGHQGHRGGHQGSNWNQGGQRDYHDQQGRGGYQGQNWNQGQGHRGGHQGSNWNQDQGFQGQGQSGWSAGPQTPRDYGPGRGPRGGGHRPKVQGGWSR